MSTIKLEMYLKQNEVIEILKYFAKLQKFLDYCCLLYAVKSVTLMQQNFTEGSDVFEFEGAFEAEFGMYLLMAIGHPGIPSYARGNLGGSGT